MAKQIKARKHALRKMITSAVLAGTAITTIGGAMGATTVEADVATKEEIAEKIINGYGRLSEATLRKILSIHGGSPLAQDRELAPILVQKAKDELFRRIEEYKAEITGYEKLAHSTANAHSTVLQELNEKKLEVINKEKTIKAKETEIEKTKTDLVKANELSDRKSEEIKNVREALNRVSVQSSRLLSKEISEKNDLKNQLKAAREVSDLLHKSLTATNDNLLKLQEQIEQTEAETNQKIADIEAKLADADFDNMELLTLKDELVKELEASQHALETLKGSYYQLANEKETLVKQIAEKDTKIAELEAGNAELTATVADLTKALEAAKKEAEENPALKAKVAELEKALAEAKGLEAKVAELEKDLEKSQAEAKDLETKLAETKAELEKVQAEKAELEATIETMKKEHAEELDKLNALLAEKEKLNEELNKMIADLKKELENQANLSNEEKAQLKAELEKLKQELAAKINMPMGNTKGMANGAGNAQTQANNGQNNTVKNQLPSTGDKAGNPFFTASAIAVMVGAGTLAYGRKRKEEE